MEFVEFIEFVEFMEFVELDEFDRDYMIKWSTVKVHDHLFKTNNTTADVF